MAFQHVYILPLVALALVIFFPIFFVNETSVSTKWRSSRKRRLIISRLAVISLLIATLITVLFPMKSLNSLVQGVIITLVMLTPAVCIHLFLSWRHAKRSSTSKTRFVRESTDNPTAAQRATGAPDEQTNERQTDSEDPERQNTEVRGQLNRTASQVRSYDLSEPTYFSPDKEVVKEKAVATLNKRAEGAQNLSNHAWTNTELANLSTDKIQEIVTGLRTDKTRLQKLVIAQHASIESEKESHERTKTVARDAVKIMRHARAKQTHAEKIARRERTERKKLELQYKEVTSALDNALSIIDSRGPRPTRSRNTQKAPV